MEDLILLIVFLGFAFAVANMSKEKDIGFWTLFAISILLSPLIGLIVGLCVKKRIKVGEYQESNSLENQSSFLSNIFKKKDKKQESEVKDDLVMPNFDKPNSGSSS